MKLPPSFSSLSLRGKRLLIRVDLNVPFTSKQNISSDKRIKLLLPSLKFFLEEGCSLCLISHLESAHAKHLQPCSKLLSQYLEEEVNFLPHCENLMEQIETVSSSRARVTLLDNLRLHPQEKEEDIEFAKQLSCLGDVFINDAFSCSHRKHSSITILPQFFKGNCAIGPLFAQELKMLSQLLEQPIRPTCLILGGCKLSTKIPLLERCSKWANEIILVGNVANEFLQQAYNIIPSSEIYRESIKSLLCEHPRLLLPLDGLIEEAGNVRVRSSASLQKGETFLDIGPYSLELIKDRIRNQGTILWNGPTGYVEDLRFSKGTNSLLEILAQSHSRTYIAGGDTLSKVENSIYAKHIDYIFSGGGASLDFMANNTLPGIEALLQNCS